ncbi:MAG: DUF4215 domain-containing protein [Deltaproteobacteria bacterium]|nr:DUF4215 domain-containing protein [Deltaproteobacteria bacterium]
MKDRKQNRWLLLMGVLLLGTMVGVGPGCSKDPTDEADGNKNSDTDSDADGDGDSDSGGDADGDGDVDSGGDGDADGDADSGDGTGGDGDTDADSDSDADVRPPGRCGDGELDKKKEACDDGNEEDGDGCSGDCREVADGYSCNPPGRACHLVVKCGDGKLLLPELCDDGNTEAGDGCSALCKVEIGWKCTEESPSVCEKTTCGDGTQEGAESCDDKNNLPFDGCNSLCQKEPDCSDGACSSECGDGLVLGEDCDDGNLISGDGCDANCKVEPGFHCYQEGCEDLENCTLTASVIYRDFSYKHSDFSSKCSGEDATLGMVEKKLGDDWKPRATAVAEDDGCTTNFDDWYNEAPSKVDQLILYPDGHGNFVNRYGEDGEPWMAYPLDAKGKPTQPDWLAASMADCEDEGLVCAPCPWESENPNPAACEPPTEAYDGTPLFFPVDDLLGDISPCTVENAKTVTDSEDACAKVPEQYGISGWVWEPGIVEDAQMHNFYFTSEVTYWFKYDPQTPATLNFTGDDDVWVFVNGQLAVDLGGVHVPLSGSVTIDAAHSFGMEAGNVYRINVFHAERKVEGSSFRLTLGGFNTARSECRPECGDGIVGLGEECDDIENDGGYGECEKGCKLGPFCGDGILQEEFEQCDPGIEPTCPNNCFILLE